MDARSAIAALTAIGALVAAAPAAAQVFDEVNGVKSLTVKPRAFEALKAGNAVVVKGGALVTFTLDGGGDVDFRVSRLEPGRRSGGGCVPGRPRTKRQRCTRAVPVPGGFAFVGIPGPNDLRFSGRLEGKALKPGAYRLIAKARGQAARSSFTRFSITG